MHQSLFLSAEEKNKKDKKQMLLVFSALYILVSVVPRSVRGACRIAIQFKVYMVNTVSSQH